ncbi:MAG: hypothetical protein FVQ85_01705 [Planctomycetes bacterium]|nr:hypothetical protein [Planctomycetota bacterium]
MRLRRIINGKSIAVIAFLVGIVFLLPGHEGGASTSDIIHAALWFIAALFTLKEKVWAAILLALLTISDLVITLIPRLKNFDADVKEMAAEMQFSESIAFISSIIGYTIGIIFIVGILYYVVSILLENKNERY